MLIGWLAVGWSSAEWQVETVDSASDVGKTNCIAIDNNGIPHISYYKNDSGDLKYAKKNGAGWEILTLDVAGTVGIFSSMVLRGGLYPYISYPNTDNRELKIAYYENNDWHIEIVPTDSEIFPETTLTLSPQGYPHIGCISSDSNQWLKIVSKSAGGWSDSGVESNVEDQDIVIDISSYIQMIYTTHPTGETTRLRWAGKYQGTTNFETIIESNHYLFDPEFYWNPEDYVSHLCYGDATTPSLEYGRKDVSTWVFQTIDPIYPAPNPCLAVDTLGYAHLLYGDAEERTLKYAWEDASGWHIEVVISEGRTGVYNSLSLDAQNIPHVCTYESDGKDLLYARKVFPTPTSPPASTPTPQSSPSPPPTPTPTSNCTTLGVHLYMPSTSFSPGDPCSCDLYLCNPDGVTYADTPVFVILDILGTYFFAPDFSNFNHYTKDVAPGMTKLVVLPVFQWPTGAGSFEGAKWYAAMTDAGISMLFGEMDMIEFSWME